MTGITDVVVKAAIAAAIVIVTQLWKEYRPEQADQDKKHIALMATILSGVFTALGYVALNAPLPDVNNGYQFAVVLFVQFVTGAMTGLTAVGGYKVLSSYGALRSVNQILVAKTPVVATVEVTSMVPELTVSAEVTETTIQPEKKTRKSNKAK